MPPGGFPPYLINEPGQPVGGLMVDLLRRIAEPAGFSVALVEAPRKRVERMLQGGELDLTARAREWTSEPDKFLFSDPILPMREVLFSLASQPVSFTGMPDLRGKSIGTHIGYHYPGLAPLFDAGRIRRDDGLNETAMMEKVLRGRNAAAAVNELTGLWLIKTHPQWAGKFVYSRNDFSRADYRFMFGPQHREFVEHFNRELRRWRDDGRLAALIRHYTPEQTVPQV